MVKNLPANTGNIRDSGLIPVWQRSPGEGDGNPTPAFLPGESHRQRNLVGYSPGSPKESDSIEMTACIHVF